MQVEIVGGLSVRATEDLLASTGLQGHAIEDERVEREPVLATIAAIVGITGTSLTVAEKVYAWYKKWRAPQPHTPIEPGVQRVLIASRDGRRLFLEDATIEDLRKIIEENRSYADSSS